MEKMVHVIPAKANADRAGKKPITKVAAYARVSTLNAEQEDSYENQKEHYETLINETEGWELAGIYADQASGMNTKKRDGFKQMLKDASRGKFQLLLVKSISRFGRNTVDTVSSIRQLKSYGIEVRFQKEQLSSTSPQVDFLLTVMASMAEQESLSISQNVRIGYQYKMKKGEHSLAYSKFLGYDRGEDGKLVINPEQAKTVRFIFDNFLSGMTLFDLTKALEREGHLTGTGNPHWTKMGVSRILKNEKMCGCALLGKTTVTDVLNKVREYNTGQAPQYFVENDHEPIVDMQTYLLAKGELIRRNHDCVKGPTLKHHRNDYSGKIVCPLCGKHYDRRVGKTGNTWTCFGRIKGGCTAPIIKEERLNALTLEALQRLWDLKPEVKLKEIPILKMDDTDSVLEKAAVDYMNNQFANRIADFCKGSRPTKYSPGIVWNLIEEITVDGSTLTYKFYNGTKVSVTGNIFTVGGFRGRRLTRSERSESHEQERPCIEISRFNGSHEG